MQLHNAKTLLCGTKNLRKTMPSAAAQLVQRTIDSIVKETVRTTGEVTVDHTKELLHRSVHPAFFFLQLLVQRLTYPLLKWPLLLSSFARGFFDLGVVGIMAINW